MKTSIAAVGLGLFASGVSAFYAADPHGAVRVLQLDTYREIVPTSKLRRRDFPGGTLVQDQFFTKYYTTISVGSKKQPIKMEIDTGSADFWLTAPTSPQCSTADGCTRGTFDNTTSDTYVYFNSKLNNTYAGDSRVQGDYFNDTVWFGDTPVNNFTMGLGLNTNYESIMGLGLPIQENNGFGLAGYGRVQGPYSDTIAIQMARNGLIKSAAFSIYTNDRFAPSGSILFGGVDTAKYSGTLETVPMVPDQNGTNRYLQVTLDSISTSRGSQVTTSSPSGFPITVPLDTGATQCLLPYEIVADVYQAFGVTNSSTGATAPCSLGNPGSGNVYFNFSGQNISVPVGQFLQTPSSKAGLPAGTCYFSLIAPLNTGNYQGGYLLGDSFLRAAYVVYDLDNYRIGLAQAVLNATDSKIVEITPGSTGIPGAQNASNIRTGAPSGTGTFQPAVTQGANTPSRAAVTELSWAVVLGVVAAAWLHALA